MSLSDKELDLIRTEREKWLPDLCTIRGPHFISEDDFSDGDKARNVPYRRQPGFGFYNDIADRFQSINAYTLTFAHNVDIAVGDKVVDEGDGQIFDVRDVRDKSSHQTGIVVLADRMS